MADPMKIRAQMKGDVCDIKVLMSHPMETGLRKDTAGNAIPIHFIRTFSVAINGKIVVDGQSGPSVSRNPVFGFKAKGAKAGDKVTVKWIDSKGESRTDEATVG
ncbi:MAG: thiosulfate oxidation carrier complex protein SoxZ [Candidatus Nitricoxidivorans perseverans]|uniref:Thiosulfate oxidation carrier complex protein SoxZ n=1 Tax=Candidatus Nitricoxidivorans perseverans TaxID=2975601 RepID=A0AA49FKF9_9PROT|nr:MAG: thiosulfate oxidation carrier complex protein SoxZ [Candidatus Nitricoxidivorans perseverans]